MPNTVEKLRHDYAETYRALCAPQAVAAGVLIIVFHTVLAALAAWVAFKFHNTVLTALAILFIGTRMRALGNIVHECTHGSFVRGGRANFYIGALLATLDLRSFESYRRDHLRHHQFLGDPKRDPDYLGTGFSVANYIANLLPVIFSRHDTYFVNLSRFVLLSSYMTLAVFFPPFVTFAVIPYFTSYLACRVLSDFSDHRGLAAASETFLRSRNHVLKNRFLNVVIFPRNDGYHLVHHIFPRLPVRAFEKMHKVLCGSHEYAGRTHSKLL